MPASGKSTLARKVARTLDLPVLEKDEIKEALFDTVGFRCYKEKRQLDVAATEVLLRCTDSILSTGQSLIIVNNFRPEKQADVEGLIAKYGARAALVFLGGNADVFYRRYVERDNLHARHLGHIVQEHYPLLPGDSPDYTMTREEFAEKFEKLGMTDFNLDCPRLEVDASIDGVIDAGAVAEWLQKTLASE